jgi:hypothetical protein
MHKLLDTSSAAIPTGVSPQRKFFRLKSGPYADRLVCFYNKSSSNLAFTWADPPYNNWTDPIALITDSADYPVGACIDSVGNIYVVYIQQTTLNLIFFRLVFYAGAWNTGAPVTILNSGLAYYPVIVRNNDGHLWCGFAYYDSAKEVFSVRVKSTKNGGLTWGSGPDDIGTILSAESSEMPYVCLNFIGNDLYAVYSEARSNLYFRRYESGGAGWSSPIQLLASDYIDSEFDCAVSTDMKLGIVICPSQADRVYFREYDGLSLSGLYEAASVGARAPQLTYKVNKPYIFFAEDIGNGYFMPRCAYRNSESFETATLVRGVGYFDSLLLYDNASQTYIDKTEEAKNLDVADVYNPSNNGLFVFQNDSLYLGMDEKFFCLGAVLATAGSGGTVIWEYFNGTNWSTFIPHSGGYGFNESNKLIYLWQDLQSSPAEWQITSVNSIKRFWVRVRVTDEFTVAPVGTQLLAVPQTDHLTLAREGL